MSSCPSDIQFHSVSVTITPVDDTEPEPLEGFSLVPADDNFSVRDTSVPLPGPIAINDNDIRVTQYTNTGAGSLRTAITTLNANPNGGTITFDTGGLARVVALTSPSASTAECRSSVRPPLAPA